MLTQLQRDAMKCAQAGDWSLADAMELLAPGRSVFRDAKLLGGVRGKSRLRMFIYGTHESCDECCGSCELRCEECNAEGDFACVTCDTAGTVTCPLCEQACLAGEAPDCATCSNTRQAECTDCKGKGRTKCEECTDGHYECTECSGSGEGDAVVEYVADLNERVIYNADDDEDGDGPPVHADFTREQAEKILHAYHNPPAQVPAVRTGAPTQTSILGDLAA